MAEMAFCRGRSSRPDSVPAKLGGKRSCWEVFELTKLHDMGMHQGPLQAAESEKSEKPCWELFTKLHIRACTRGAKGLKSRYRPHSLKA